MKKDEYYRKLIKKNLQPLFWDKHQKFNEDIRDQLVLIAEKFYESLDLNAPIRDIYLVGSLANYNWTLSSDLDVHIILRYEDISPDRDLVEKYLELERKEWNNMHEIDVLGFEVEVSFNDINDVINSAAIYSLLNRKWVKKPIRKPITASVAEESQDIVDMIERAIDNLLDKYENENISELKTYQRAKQIWKVIKKLRSDYLEEEGEFGPKNLAFKKLRYDGYLDKIVDLKTETHDEILSIHTLQDL